MREAKPADINGLSRLPFLVTRIPAGLVAPIDPAALRHARKAAGVTISQAARRAHVTPESVAMWEYGEDEPTAWQVGMLVRAYRVSVEAVLAADARVSRFL